MNALRKSLNTALAAALLAAGSAIPANADLLLSLQSVTAPQGSTGKFDVLVTNEGITPQNVTSFQFELDTTNPHINFFDVSTIGTSAPYLLPFGVGGADITASSTGNTIVGSDIEGFGIGTDIAPGATYSLGLVSFDAANGASGEVATIRFANSPRTLVSDANGNLVAFTTESGAISITPEPASLAFAGIGLLSFFAARRRRMLSAADSIVAANETIA